MIKSTLLRASVNTFVLYVKLCLSTLIAFFNIPLLLRALGTENYGIFCIVGGIIALLLFLNGTMTTATNRFLAVAEGRNDSEQDRIRTFNLCLLLHITIAIVIAFSLEVIALFFWDKLLNIAVDRQFAAKVVFQTMVLSTFCSVATIPYSGVIIAKERMIFFATATLASSLAKFGITFLLFGFAGDRLIFYALLVLSIILLERLAHILYAHYLVPIRYTIHNLNHSLFREMAVFFGWSMTINFSLPAVINGTSVLLNKFFGVIVNAAEGIAAQVAGQLTGICGNLINAVSPIIMKCEGGARPEEALNIALTTCRASAYLLILIIPAVFWEMPYLLELWLRNVPPFTIIFCRLILIRMLVEQISLPLAILMNANGNIKWMQISSSIVYLLTLGVEAAILFSGAPPHSVYYCIIGMMVVIGIIRMGCVKNQYGMSASLFLKGTVLRVGSIFLCGILSIAWLPFYIPSSIWRCAAAFGISAIVTLICILAFGLTDVERGYLKQGVQKLKTKWSPKQEKTLL